MKQSTRKKAYTIPTLEERLAALHDEIEVLLQAHFDAIAKENPGIPRAGIEQRFFMRAGGCRCAAFRILNGQPK